MYRSFSSSYIWNQFFFMGINLNNMLLLIQYVYHTVYCALSVLGMVYKRSISIARVLTHKETLLSATLLNRKNADQIFGPNILKAVGSGLRTSKLSVVVHRTVKSPSGHYDPSPPTFPSPREYCMIYRGPGSLAIV
jgi:hypothetical protein